jgi:endonuclease/exonuclease/phosphatase family metal-dependent hydrolase
MGFKIILRLLLLGALLFPLCAFGAEEKQSLRVVTFNIWGIPYTRHQKLRLKAIASELKKLKADLVAFQELWHYEDVEPLTKALEEIGLKHTKRFPGLTGGGLLIASRFPIEKSAFLAFSLAGNPRALQHCDYYGGKGIGLVQVKTKLGPVVFANTHLHASYNSTVYDAEQLSQLLEVSNVLGAPELQRKADVDWVEGKVIIFGGDINRRWDTLACEMFLKRSHFNEAREKQGIDALFSRSTKGLFIRSLGGKAVLNEKVALGPGVIGTLSDHAGVMVDFVISKKPGVSNVKFATTKTRAWEAICRDIVPIVRREVSTTQTYRLIDCLVTIFFIGLTVILWKAETKWRWMRGMGFVLCLFICAVLIFLTIHDHNRIQGLSEIVIRLSR